MPATAGRVRMPANNRVHSSAALQTHGIWQSAIGYDPYAPNKDDSKYSSGQVTAAAEPDGENAYASFQGLLALARITGSNADEALGACRKCGRVGHLTFQCKNFVSLKESKEKDPEVIQAAVLNGLDKLKGGKVNGKEVEGEDEESESSDSDVDSEIERIIAERSGKKVISKGRKSLKKKTSGEDDSSDSDLGERKKRGRSKKRSSRKRATRDSDDEKESRRKRWKEKRKKRDESSDEDDDRRHTKRKSRKEKRRRRSHRHPDDSESSDVSDDSGKRHRRKSQRHESPSDSDVSGSDDLRVGRGAKRSEKSSRKRRHEDDE
ncbi:CAX-interacting protein 4 [Hibiscus syriacus]|uniref:CAX-interacting protein 4 n=1 Tax=Hibiscus syriacus TaxID=106335 RepID=A0A6A3B4G3_HIBSY|nr:CAX-interacting protein 4-like [Hibiscus syriacus]XP_038992766.1 CAX-interacting protein 4-like [Hibiscus syriacus]KAE8711431.1 CAX-interacting protein 4 [Hibiscus syriacus]